jgi:hypothetical protein
MPFSKATIFTAILLRNDPNDFYCYSPAEWAIVGMNFLVLNVFLGAIKCKERAQYAALKLLIFCLKSSHFEAFKHIYFVSKVDIKLLGFLSIAARGQVAHEFLEFLVFDCGLLGEINSSFCDGITCETPFRTAIKFKNIRAALSLMQFGSPLMEQRSECKHLSALTYLFEKNRSDMLSEILEVYSDSICSESFVDGEGDTIFHYAALYAVDYRTVDKLLKMCWKLKVDPTNEKGLTPLGLTLSNPYNQDTVRISETFIRFGADIFKVFDRFILIGHVGPLFAFMYGFFREKESIFRRIIEKICKFGAWEFLEFIILNHQQNEEALDPSWVNISQRSVAGLMDLKCHVTFRFAVEHGKIVLNEEISNLIRQSGDGEFLKIINEQK